MNIEAKLSLGLTGLVGGTLVLGGLRSEKYGDRAEEVSDAQASHIVLLSEQSDSRAQIEGILEGGLEGITCEPLPMQALAAPGLLCDSPTGQIIVSFLDHEKSLN